MIYLAHLTDNQIQTIWLNASLYRQLRDDSTALEPTQEKKWTKSVDKFTASLHVGMLERKYQFRGLKRAEVETEIRQTAQ